MFAMFSRPAGRRPRNVRRNAVRPALRVEALEARANPDANPALANISATWIDASQVVITGTVTDTSTPTTVFVGGAGSGTVQTNPQGGFLVAVTLNTSGAVLLAAQPVTMAAPAPVTIVAADQLTLTNVTLTQNQGGSHITGQVVGGTPGSTVIQITSSVPSVNGTVPVENPDGTFDIAIAPANGEAGGSISIQAFDNTTDESSNVWSGFFV